MTRRKAVTMNKCLILMIVNIAMLIACVGVSVYMHIIHTKRERALAAAIIEVDGGQGKIDEVLSARGDSDKALHKQARKILDRNDH